MGWTTGGGRAAVGGKGRLNCLYLTYLVPPTILFIPLSRVIATLKLQDSLWSLA
jgi:hypothetical protein